MKIIAAPDSFKGSMSASQVSRIIADEILKYDPKIEVITKSMADGGEGTAEALLAAGNGKWITKEVTGPLPDMKVNAAFAWFERDKEAVVEMAKASGIELLPKEQLNTLKTTTYGTGQPGGFCSLSQNFTLLSVRQKVRQFAVDTGSLVISGSTC